LLHPFWHSGFGLVISLTNTANSELITVVSVAAGIITNFVAAIFFYLYNRTVQQLKGYHDSLLDVQNILLSFKIVGDLTDESQKAGMALNMIGFLISKQRMDSSQTTASSPDSV
jgi:hypothetical protein